MESIHRRVLTRWRSLDWLGWWGDYVDARFELAHRAGQLDAEVVLDLGCGHGVILAEVRDSCRRVGVDLSLERLAQARGLVPGALFVRADMRHLPFRGGVFDTVLMAGVYEILPDKRAFLAEVGKTLCLDGKIIATTPNGQHWQYWYLPVYHHAGEVESSFSDFSSVRVEGYNPMPSLHWLLPRKILQYLPNPWTKYFFVPTGVLVWIPGLTRLFRRLMALRCLRRFSKFLFIRAHR